MSVLLYTVPAMMEPYRKGRCGSCFITANEVIAGSSTCKRVFSSAALPRRRLARSRRCPRRLMPATGSADAAIPSSVSIEKEQMAILNYCRENGMSFHLNDLYLSIISPISQWRVTVSPSGTTMLYHKNTEFRASDAASAIRGYHNQRIRFQSLLQHFTYITSHDAYRMHHRERPALPLRKTAEAKGTAQKGHKALAQGADAAQSGRTQARDPQCAGAHRFARCRLRRAPGSLKLRFPQHKMTEPRADCPWL